MSKIYNHNEGRFDEREIVIPEFTQDQRNRLYEMLTDQADAARKRGGNVITGSPIDYVSEQERRGQQIVRTMGENGLILSNPGLILTISEQDWPIRDRIGFMSDRKLLQGSNIIDSYTDWINNFQKRQQLPTGVVPILDQRLQTRGKAFSEMVELNKAVSQEISLSTMGKYSSRMLGVLANLDYHAQSAEKRAEMEGGSLDEYTEDITGIADGGDVVGIDDWHACGRAGLNAWGGDYVRPYAGARFGVVESNQNAS